MEKDFVTKMKEILLGQKEAILKVLAHESEDFQELIDSKDPKDLADIASDDIDKKILEALENQELRRLRLIDSALSRMENNKYGICMECGDKIPFQRLEALPYSLLCLNCKSKEEKRRR